MGIAMINAHSDELPPHCPLPPPPSIYYINIYRGREVSEPAGDARTRARFWLYNGLTAQQRMKVDFDR